MISRLEQVTRGIDAMSYWAIAITMLGMSAIVIAQVITRYVFNSSIDSADELSRLFFVWVIFLSIPQGVKYAVHVGIDLLVTKCSEARQAQLYRLTCALSIFLMLVVLYSGTLAVMDKWVELMPTLNMTAAVYYIPILICAVHSLLHLVLQWCDPALRKVSL